MTIREMLPADLDRAFAINQMNLKDVDAISIADLGSVLADSRIALVAVEPEGSVVGFCLIIDETCGYLSDRASWAINTSGSGLHIDRVVFDMSFSGFGLGLALYNELDRRIEESGETTLTSLVRIDPPNTHSVGFHNSRGFVTLAESMFDGNKFALMRRAFPG
ncbi:MAG: GNAT family N-acetyltransferase [Actinomycetia bacterium]|nr:GNAT family N-acetyltransferase [Actinomycetes bacterium]